MVDVDHLESLRQKAHAAPIVMTSIGLIDASDRDLALDFPQADWDMLLAARQTYHADIEHYHAALLSNASAVLKELRASRQLLAYSVCPQCGGKIEPLYVAKNGAEQSGRTILTERDYEICLHPYHTVLATLQPARPCLEFEIHPEHCEVIRRCRLQSDHAGQCDYGAWV